MYDPLSNPDYEFLRPLVTGWLGKLEAAERSRKKWKELKDECMMFYSSSAAAMWDPSYSKKFWTGIKAPKFRITINKAFELVAVFGPNLLWEVPSRTVTPKKHLEIPPELFEADPGAQQIYQQLQQQQAYGEAQDKTVAFLMQAWLNYTPMQQPAGGLVGQSELAITDALIKGRGVLCQRTYQPPASGRTLTGSFREPPENLLTDPDFKTLDTAKWIAIKHIDPHWAVERRFGWPANSLRGKASMESSWNFAEISSEIDKGTAKRAAGRTNDLLVWWEIYSKTGCGARLTGMETVVKDHLEDVVGDYAYLAISADVPCPLNCSTDKLRGRMTDEQVKEAFSWPTPMWADDRWPIEVIDFYLNPEEAWPIPPLAPAMGELKFMNFLVPWLCNRIYSSSRDFWAVAGPHVDHYTKYLNEGLDQTIIPTPIATQTDDVRKLITVLQQPETRADGWKIYELVSEQFDKRTGLTEFGYGGNPGGTQSRTAEDAANKKSAYGVRPEFMQKKVAAWQSRVAQVEAFLTRWFITGEDVQPLLGPVGAYLWQQHIQSTDVELVVRQMQYDVGAASIRRPDRDRDIANFQQVMQYFAPTAAAHGQQTGQWSPYNAIVKKWAEFHDADLDEMLIPDQEQNQQAQQMQMTQQQLEVEKLQAEVNKLTAEAESAQMQGQAASQQKQAELAAKTQELQLAMLKGEMDLKQSAQSHAIDISAQKQKNKLDITQQKRMGDVKVQVAKKTAAAKPKPSANGARR